MWTLCSLNPLCSLEYFSLLTKQGTKYKTGKYPKQLGVPNVVQEQFRIVW